VIADLIAAELAATVGGRRPVTPGAAFVTGPGELAASHGVRHVIHVAAVQGEPGAGFQQIRKIDRCVTSALTAADQLAYASAAVRTILFPVLGVGVAGASVPHTVRAMVDAAVDYLTATPETPLRAVYFLAYTDLELAAFDEVIHGTPNLVPIDTPAG
jgi:O-acetyl-ADP-ribose deacetylase (regulator of RNase III)